MLLSSIKGIGEKTEKLFHKLGVNNVKDLLLYFPRDYKVFPAPRDLSDIHEEGIYAVEAMISNTGITTKYVNKLSITNMTAQTKDGLIKITYFNMPFLKKTVKPGTIYIFYGKLYIKNNQYYMEQPKMFSPSDYNALVHKLQPVYTLTKGLSNKIVQSSVMKALDTKEYLPKEILPDNLLDKYNFTPLSEAIKQIHFPESKERLIQARKRMAYQEFFLFLLQMHYLENSDNKQANYFQMIEVAETKRLIEKLPYQLTNDQLNVWNDIVADMGSEYTMSRLVQGDVGSGKTIIAILSLLMTVCNGHQGALMAPTEVLAEQHFESISSLTKDYHLPFKPILLTGSLTAKQKREAYKEIASGEVNVIIGTHALIQEKVDYYDLALAITDEQHRFGVKQRQHLSQKGYMPHILVMSATPIPRTLAMILYGNFDLSVIKQMPVGRLPIKNCVVPTSYRNTAYKFIMDELIKKHQVYIVCPMVEENEELGLENVEDYTKKLISIFPEKYQITCLHGKMKPAMKNQIMDDFKNKKIDVLVSTTVIEVGINVPNATVMMIENAERFGLAQLHQLRGRVGRGKEQSYCIFIYSNNNEQVKDRLKVLEKSNDGFLIASEDMKRRGPGDLFGIRQSGALDFKIADIYQDGELLKNADSDIKAILEEDYHLNLEIHSSLKEYIMRDEHLGVDFTTI